jgi:flagellar assembly protein FliH
MSAIIPKENLTAFQRWELGSFDQGKAPAAKGGRNKAAAASLPTADDIERIHNDAHKQGYAAGYEEGTARARIEALRLHTLVEHLDAALTDFDQQVAEQLLQLALGVARQVVRQTIAVRPTAILDAVRDALLQLPHQHAAIYLHPEDASLVRTYLGDQLTHTGHRLFEEASISRGGVRIEAGGSHLDATVETRWRRAIESIGIDSEWLEPPQA